MSAQRTAPARGLTIIELMVVVVLLGVLVALAAPSMRGLISVQRVRGVNAELVTDLQYARIDEILEQDPETWLQDAMARLDRLGNAIHRQFMVSTDIASPVMAARPWGNEQ